MSQKELIIYVDFLLVLCPQFNDTHNSYLLRELEKSGYRSLLEVDNAVNRAEQAVIAYENQYPPRKARNGRQTKFTAAGFVVTALFFADATSKELLHHHADNINDTRYEFMHLVKEKVLK